MRMFETLETRRMMTASMPTTVGLGPVVNPVSFGAKYNGTTDDAPAIQAAINSLPRTGGTVLISGMAAVGKEGINLIGAAPMSG